MSPYIEYLLKVSIGLMVVTGFYQLALRKFTFYNWNRWYLLGYSLLVFFIPFLNVERQLKEVNSATIKVVRMIPVVQDYTKKEVVANSETPAAFLFNLSDICLIVILLGGLLMLVRACVAGYAFYKIKKKARLISNQGVKLFDVNKDIMPFSFGNSIFINRNLHDENDLKEIILHEYIHIRQKHTIDILWAELICVLNWYNPFAWMLRSAIRQNLEFIADRAVLENGTDAKAYQYLLLKVVGVPEFRIASQFNFSSLKQRIKMMNKMKTARIHLIRFLFVLPLLCVLLVAFRSDIKHQLLQQKNTIYIAGLLVDAETGERVANMPLKLGISGETTSSKKAISTDMDGYYYYEMSTSNLQDSVVYFGISGQGKYEKFEMGSSLKKGTPDDGDFMVSFLAKDDEIGNIVFKRHTIFPYFVSKKQYFDQVKIADIRNDLKAYLANQESAFKRQYDLKAAFAEAFPKPAAIITKFRNAYFDQFSRIIGYEKVVKFYLDGKEVDYTEINKVFSEGKISFVFGENHNSNEFETVQGPRMYYYTYELSKQKPSEDLVNDNFEILDTQKFDRLRLGNEPYFLNGFRAEVGLMSRSVSPDEKIKRVVLLKGDLAKYYDKKLENILWIETLDAQKIRIRPDFRDQ